MSAFWLPLGLTILAIIFAFSTYRNIRRGGARHYTLEREAVLRRASFTLFLSALFFIGSVAMLVVSAPALPGAELEPGAAGFDSTAEALPSSATTPAIDQFPPTPAESPTPIPTPTTTPIIRRGMIEGTAGSGLSLREEPTTNSATITVLPDGSIVTLLDTESVEADGIVWVRVRTIANEEGWVASQYLVTRDR